MAFPDPSLHDFDALKVILQKSCPLGVSVSTISVERLTVTQYQWVVLYRHQSSEFPNPNDFECEKAKASLQKKCPAGGSIGSVTTTLTVTQECMWKVVYKKKDKYSIKLIDFIPCIKSSSPNPLLSKYQVKREDQILTVEYSELKSTDRVRKVFSEGRDITRRLCQRTRISNSRLIAFFKKAGIIKHVFNVDGDSKTICHESDENRQTCHNNDKAKIVVIPKTVTATKVGLECASNVASLGSLKIVPQIEKDPSQSRQSLTVTAQGSDSATKVEPFHPPPLSYARVCQIAKLRVSHVFGLVFDYLSVDYGMIESGPLKNNRPIRSIGNKPLFQVE